MKAEELRIGNLVKIVSFGKDELPENDKISVDLGWRIFVVNSSLIKGVEKNPDYAIKPIEISHDWLERFGFKPLKNIGYRLDFSDRMSLLYRLYDNKVSLRCYDTSCEIFAYNVHELQNLYYSLTGEELTYE